MAFLQGREELWSAGLKRLQYSEMKKEMLHVGSDRHQLTLSQPNPVYDRLLAFSVGYPL